MHTQASRKVCMHTVTLINVHDSLHTCRHTGPTWTGLPSYTRNQANKCTRAHTRTLARTLTTLLFCRAYWGLGGLFWSHAQRRTHTDTHTLQTSSCPLTLKTLPVPVNHSALPLPGFLCCCYGFLLRSWRFYCSVTAVPVYPVTAYCSLCLPSSPKLLSLHESRFASQVAHTHLTVLFEQAQDWWVQVRRHAHL